MAVWILMALHLAAGQDVTIGSALDAGTDLVYESGGGAQAPWVYESVRTVDRDGFERCVRVERRGQAARETCVRDNLLFEPNPDGELRAVRPIGAGMVLEVKTASGQIMRFETGTRGTRQIGQGAAVDYVSTTITTRNAEGTVVRRLREEYAPSLLTALKGEFEEPDGSGGWRTVRAFSLVEIRRSAR